MGPSKHWHTFHLAAGEPRWCVTPIWRRMRVGLSFSKATLFFCGHLRGIRGEGSNSHTSQQRLPFQQRQHAVPIGSVAGAWRLAGSVLIGSSRSIMLPPLDFLGTYDGERVIPHSLCGLVPSLAKPCDVGFLPVQRYREGRHWVAGEKQLVL